MKKWMIFLLAVILVTCIKSQTLYICQGQSYTAVTASNAGNMKYSDGGSKLTIAGITYNVSDIDSIVFKEPTFTSAVSSDTIYVAYNGSTAGVTYNNSLVQASVNGANVTITSTATETELTYILSGTSTNGSLVINGDYKLRVVLNGLTLTNPSGAAIDVECGKRIAVELADGTTNSLVDGVGGSQKGCFYIKGHAEFEGGGALTLTGNSKHALFSKEYVELKKSTGSVTIAPAVGDGVHS